MLKKLARGFLYLLKLELLMWAALGSLGLTIYIIAS